MEDPEFLILDEPFVGLDPKAAVVLKGMMRKLCDSGGAIFFSTHVLEEAEKLCDHVALLYQGNIVEFGTPQEICLKYNREKRYHLLLNGSKEELVLEQNPENAEKISEWMRKDMILCLHSCEPTLESVFLEVTGASLAP